MIEKILSLLSALLLVGIMATIAVAGTAQSRIVDISASNYFSATAMDDNGSLWKWGGPGNFSLPGIVPGISGVKETSGAGMYTLALKDDGTVWFMDLYPRPGVSGAFDRIGDPVKIEGVGNVTAISCRTDQWLALKDDGTVWIFDMSAMRLVSYMGLANVRQISQSDDHSVFVRCDGSIISHGWNDFGQLGMGTRQTNQGPVRDPDSLAINFTAGDLHNVTMAAAGFEFTVAVTEDGTVWTWGRSSEGELGDGASTYNTFGRACPQRVPGLDHIVSVAAGQWSAYALRDDGTVWAWGDNRNFGALGDGTFESRSTPVQVTGLAGIVEISATELYTLALDKYGNVWAWGRDSNGQLGDGGIHQYGCSATPEIIAFSQSVAGPAIAPAWMVPERPVVATPTDSPIANTGDDIRYLAIAKDNTIYAFTEHELRAYRPDKSLKWTLALPGKWMWGDEYSRLVKVFDDGGYTTNRETATPIFATDDGHVYLYVLTGLPDGYSVTMDRWQSNDPTKVPIMDVEKALVAISPDGNVEWTYRLTENIGMEDRISVTVVDDRIYFYHCYAETVLDRSGHVLFSLDNIAAPAAIGSDGTLYAFPARRSDKTGVPMIADPATGGSVDYRIPGTVLEAYNGSGRQIWSKDLGVPAEHPYYKPEVRRQFDTLPLLGMDRLYVPLKSGLMALDMQGNALWTDEFGSDVSYLLDLMPMDSKGNLYYLGFSSTAGTARIMSVAPDGRRTTVDCPNFAQVSAGYNGVLYEVAPASDAGSVTVKAFDVQQGSYKWSYTLPVGQSHTVLVDSANAELFFGCTMAFHPVRQGTGYAWANIIPSGDLVYVDFRAASYESPVVLNETNVTYASAIFAIDNQSGIVAQQPLDSFTTAVAANNSTIVYATDNGGPGLIVVAAAAAGIGLIAAALLFAKFFMFGTVARARSRLDDNKNRGSVLKFVADNPGATLSEISRDTGMNMGTVRYHVFVLELNHKVKPFREGKFIRYFPNSNFYSPEEQLVISMMRREPIRAIISTLAGSPGQTNSDLSRVLGQSESAVSEHMKVLCDRGITVKEKSEDGRILFSVSAEVRATIGHLRERLAGYG